MGFENDRPLSDIARDGISREGLVSVSRADIARAIPDNIVIAYQSQNDTAEEPVLHPIETALYGLVAQGVLVREGSDRYRVSIEKLAQETFMMLGAANKGVQFVPVTRDQIEMLFEKTVRIPSVAKGKDTVDKVIQVLLERKIMFTGDGGYTMKTRLDAPDPNQREVEEGHSLEEILGMEPIEITDDVSQEAAA